MNIRKLLASLASVSFCLVGTSALIGCDDKPKSASDSMHDAKNDVKDAAHDAKNDVKDAAHDTKNAVKDATH